jgi:hypothetical protein
MSTILIILILLLLLGGGGGYYYGGPAVGGRIGGLVVLILIIWLIFGRRSALLFKSCCALFTVLGFLSFRNGIATPTGYCRAHLRERRGVDSKKKGKCKATLNEWSTSWIRI